MKMTWVIYKCTNSVNNKVYIGCTNDFRLRKNAHKHDYKIKNTKLYRDMRKYGWHNFKWGILKSNILTEVEAYRYESIFIKRYYSMTLGYNSTTGGNRGKRFSLEYKKLLSSQRQGANHNLAKRILCVETGKVYGYIKQCAKDMGFKSSINLTNAIRKRGRYKGYTFRYLDDPESNTKSKIIS